MNWDESPGEDGAAGEGEPGDGEAGDAWSGDEDEPLSGDEDGPVRWPLTWHGLYPRELWLWFERLWSDVCALRVRYRLAVRSQWWEDELQVETLAALAAWIDRYDSDEWDDPPGKLALIFDLERISTLLRDGLDPFDPARDRRAFENHVLALGGLPPRSE